MRNKGVGKVANARCWSRTVVIDVLFAFYLAAILELFYFLFCAHSSPIISHRPVD
jgi:hypothetical protein